jgi:hypothetical protein
VNDGVHGFCPSDRSGGTLGLSSFDGSSGELTVVVASSDRVQLKPNQPVSAIQTIDLAVLSQMQRVIEAMQPPVV